MRIGNLSASLLVVIAALILAYGCARTSPPSESSRLSRTLPLPDTTPATPTTAPVKPTPPVSHPAKKPVETSKDEQIAALQKAVAERDAQIAALKRHTSASPPQQVTVVPNETPDTTSSPDSQPRDSGRSLKVKMQSFVSHYVFSHPSKAITVENANVRDVRVMDVKQNPSATYPYAVYTYVFLNYTPGTDEYNRAPMGTREQYLYLCNPDTGDVASVKTF